MDNQSASVYSNKGSDKCMNKDCPQDFPNYICIISKHSGQFRSNYSTQNCLSEKFPHQQKSLSSLQFKRIKHIKQSSHLLLAQLCSPTQSINEMIVRFTLQLFNQLALLIISIIKTIISLVPIINGNTWIPRISYYQLLLVMIYSTKSVQVGCKYNNQSSLGCISGCQSGYAYLHDFELANIDCVPCHNCNCPIGQYYEPGNLGKSIGCQDCPKVCLACSNPYFCDDGKCACDSNTNSHDNAEISCYECTIELNMEPQIRLRNLVVTCDINCTTAGCDTTTGACSECSCIYGNNLGLSGGKYQYCVQDGYKCTFGSNCRTSIQHYGTTCLSCTRPCYSCFNGATKCTSCINGYYLDILNSICHPCTSTSCQVCKPVYTSANSSPTSNICKLCNNGQYLSSGQCYYCASPCANCVSSSSCTSCLAGYSLIAGVCAMCAAETYFNGSDCVSCITPCYTCTSDIICTSCIVGYTFDAHIGCFTCISPCLTCTATSTTCDSCIPTYYLTGSTCQPCVSPCQTCTSSTNQSNTNCLSCIDGYYISLNQCYRCQPPCLTCQIALSQLTCLSCIDTKQMIVLNGSCTCNSGMFYIDGKCEQCSLPCTSCINSSDYCLTCNGLNVQSKNGLCESDPGFVYNIVTHQSDKCNLDCLTCQTIDYCNDCSFKNTSLQYGQCNCIDQYYLSEPQQCKKCISPCVTCLSSVYCLSCAKTHYLTGSLCQTCMIGCDLCDDSSTCLQCSSDYMQIEHINSRLVTCLVMDQSTKQFTELTTSVINPILWILLGLCIFGFLNGGISVFYNLLDIIQLVSYLQFINTVHPYNLKQLFSIFQFAQLKLMTNYLNLNVMIENYIETYDMYVGPQLIMDEGYSTISYLNGLTTLPVWIAFLLTYYACRVIIQLCNKITIQAKKEDNFTIIRLKQVVVRLKIWIVQICSFVVTEAFYSGVYRIYYSIAYDNAFTFCLTLSTSYFYTDNHTLLASQYFAILLFIIYCAVLCKSIWVLDSSMQKLFSHQNRFRSLIEGLKKEPRCIYFNVFLLFKKFLVMVSLIFCYYDPIFQIGNIMLLSSIEILYLLILKPLQESYEWKKEFFSEFCMLISEFSLFVLVLDEIVPNNIVNRNTTGWIIILAISSILITQMLLDFYQQWKTYIRLFRQVAAFFESQDTRRKKIAQKLSKIQMEQYIEIQR